MAESCSKAELRKRWQDAELTLHAREDLDRLVQAKVGCGLDFRGASLGVAGGLPHLALLDGTYMRIDVSWGKGVIVARAARIESLVVTGFHFDRAARFSKCELRNSSFVGSRGRYDAHDTEFIGCDFTESEFRGGLNEYGFRRCRFVDCRLDRIDWTNCYLRVCEFRDCTFENARIAGSLVVAAKLFGFDAWETLFADSSVESVFVDGVRVERR